MKPHVARYLAGSLALIASFLVFTTIAAAQTAGQPELPRATVATAYVAPTGVTINVPAGGSLQSAIDSANPGDTIVLQAGATYTGNFVLRAKAGSAPIHIRSSAAASLPVGVRVSPAQASLMAKVVTVNSSPVFRTEAGASNYRLIGLEVTVASGVSSNNGLITIGDGSQSTLSMVPENIIVDRCYVHGSATGSMRRGVALNGASSAVIDSYLSEFHWVGVDTQAVCGWNGPGPFKIENNYLEAAAENILFGGADPSIQGLIPSDIEVTRNTLSKPLRWRVGDPSYAGYHWSVKNLFELKNARRVLVEGNVMENSWADAQRGFAVLFTVRNQDGGAPWSAIEDVTFRNNTVRRAGAGINVLGTDDVYPSDKVRRVAIRNNVFEEIDAARWGGNGRLVQVLAGPEYLTIEHNTAFQSGPIVFAEGPQSPGFVFRNNTTNHNDGIDGTGTAAGTATLTAYFPNAVVAGNVMAGGSASSNPSGNHYPATMDQVGFVSLLGGNYRLVATSPYNNAGTDGRDIGADIDALDTACGATPSGGGGGSTPTPVTVSVTWSSLVRTTVTGTTIFKSTGRTGRADAGAVSSQTIAAGNGHLEFRSPETWSERAVGLSRGNTDTSVSDIDYAVRFASNGWAQVRENGNLKASVTYAAGDVFKIAVQGSSVVYYKNGAVIYTSSRTPSYPLLVDTSFTTLNGTIDAATLTTEN